MGRLFMVNLEGQIYSCKYCRTHLALYDDIISKSFHSRHGKAYLFNKVVNVCLGKIEDRLMMTGMHTVADIFCVGCGSIVGWKYETAHEKNQKYKEGKSVLERSVLNKDTLKIKISASRDALVRASPDSWTFYITAKYTWFKVLGPDEISHWISHEADTGGSEGDDV